MAIINPPNWQQSGKYSARMDRQVLDGIIGRPGITSEEAFKIVQVSPNPEMKISVLSGNAYVQGTETIGQGMYHVHSDGEFTVNIGTSDTINTRIDLVYLRIYDSEVSGTRNEAVVEVRQGVPSSSPEVPAMPASSIPLAQITIAPNSSSVLAENVLDLRVVAEFHSSLTRNLIQKPEPWRSISGEGLYASNWRDYPSTYQRPSFRKFAGTVELCGLVQGTATLGNNTTVLMFTLPAGYRPQSKILTRGIINGVTGTTGPQTSGTAHTHSIGLSNKMCRFEIETDGKFSVYTGSSTTAYAHISSVAAPWMTLSGVKFPV